MQKVAVFGCWFGREPRSLWGLLNICPKCGQLSAKKKFQQLWWSFSAIFPSCHAELSRKSFGHKSWKHCQSGQKVTSFCCFFTGFLFGCGCNILALVFANCKHEIRHCKTVSFCRFVMSLQSCRLSHFGVFEHQHLLSGTVCCVVTCTCTRRLSIQHNMREILWCFFRFSSRSKQWQWQVAETLVVSWFKGLETFDNAVLLAMVCFSCRCLFSLHGAILEFIPRQALIGGEWNCFFSTWLVVQKFGINGTMKSFRHEASDRVFPKNWSIFGKCVVLSSTRHSWWCLLWVNRRSSNLCQNGWSWENQLRTTIPTKSCCQCMFVVQVNTVRMTNVDEMEFRRKERKLRIALESRDGTGLSLLHYNAIQGNVGIVKDLLQLGCSVNLPDGEGNTPLHWAAWMGKVEMLEFLLKAGGNVNVRNNKRETVLIKSVRADRVMCVRAIFGHPGQFDNGFRMRKTKNPEMNRLLEGTGFLLYELQKKYLKHGPAGAHELLKLFDNVRPKNEFCLMELARDKIRSHLQRMREVPEIRGPVNLFPLVEELPLPRAHKDFLLFNHSVGLRWVDLLKINSCCVQAAQSIVFDTDRGNWSQLMTKKNKNLTTSFAIWWDDVWLSMAGIVVNASHVAFWPALPISSQQCICLGMIVCCRLETCDTSLPCENQSRHWRGCGAELTMDDFCCFALWFELNSTVGKRARLGELWRPSPTGFCGENKVATLVS